MYIYFLLIGLDEQLHILQPLFLFHDPWLLKIVFTRTWLCYSSLGKYFQPFHVHDSWNWISGYLWTESTYPIYRTRSSLTFQVDKKFQFPLRERLSNTALVRRVSLTFSSTFLYSCTSRWTFIDFQNVTSFTRREKEVNSDEWIVFLLSYIYWH